MEMQKIRRAYHEQLYIKLDNQYEIDKFLETEPTKNA